jgi:NAD(P)-dependent dehydrogenase (short-subunit alcohol dehydrogenase family)
MIRQNPDGSPVTDSDWNEMIAYAPMRRIADPAEIAAAILYLASGEARFVTGAALQIDGGSTAGRVA